jgi:Protein of unknown function (DUF541)
MKSERMLVVLALCVLSGCARGAAPNSVNENRANVGETLAITLAPATVAQAIQTMQADPALDDPRVAIQIEPLVAPRRTSDVQTDTYVAALDDARAKAATIAARLGLRLGPVRSIDELVPQNSTFARPGPMAPAMGQPESIAKRMTLPAAANGVVTLAVTFDAGGVPISVFGVRAGARPEAASHDANGITLTLRARGTDLRDAQAHLRVVESAARSIAHRLGASDAAIQTTAANASTY